MLVVVVVGIVVVVVGIVVVGIVVVSGIVVVVLGSEKFITISSDGSLVLPDASVAVALN